MISWNAEIWGPILTIALLYIFLNNLEKEISLRRGALETR